MSTPAFGPKAKCRDVRYSAAVGVKADSARTSQNRRDWPVADFSRQPWRAGNAQRRLLSRLDYRLPRVSRISPRTKGITLHNIAMSVPLPIAQTDANGVDTELSRARSSEREVPRSPLQRRY